jgi:cytochrome b
MSIFLGLLILAAGVFLVVKTEWFLSNFGRIAWFEAKLGSEGGSRLGYKLVGIILLILGIIVMTGSGGDFGQWALSPLLKYSGGAK